jgi:rSAM/selenodomain-associated transferase 1
VSNLPKVAKKHLIIFTRYPEPGKTKTRLIPALGSEGAARLHRQMTEHTLVQVKQLQKVIPISWEVRFAGGNYQLMQDWLGAQLIYQPQGEGDLGKRMERSLFHAFESQAEYAVIIGTDCPALNAEILALAFEELEHCELVLGPARDGGYYLIGLRYPRPELFTNIDWGTNRVFSQTVEIAHKLNLSMVSLPVLADIDRPEDLCNWEAHLVID